MLTDELAAARRSGGRPVAQAPQDRLRCRIDRQRPAQTVHEQQAVRKVVEEPVQRGIVLCPGLTLTRSLATQRCHSAHG
jgi:hypothetical protein